MRLGNAVIRWMSAKVPTCPPHEWIDASHAHEAYGVVYLLQCTKDPNHVWPDLQRRR